MTVGGCLCLHGAHMIQINGSMCKLHMKRFCQAFCLFLFFQFMIIIKDKNKIKNAANGRHKLNYKFVAGIKHIGINRRGIIEKIVAERKDAKNIDGFICFWHKMLRQI